MNDATELPDTLAPPKTWRAKIAYLGPGIIVAGSIVGAGELIATTSTGAVAGFSLLWLIIIGCVIKVFVQVELGKHTVLTGKGTMQMLSEMPGPRFPGNRFGGANWALACWFIMFLSGIASLGALLNGVGQAMAIATPITQQARAINARQAYETKRLLLSRSTIEDLILAQDAIPNGQANLPDARLQTWKSLVDSFLRDPQIHLSAKQQTQADALQGELNQNPALYQNGFLGLLTKDIAAERERLERSKTEPVSSTRAARLQTLATLQQQVQESNVAEDRDRNPDTAENGNPEASPSFANLEAMLLEEEQTSAPDAFLWSMAIGVVSMILLVIGRFKALEMISLVLVGLFTVATIVNIVLLQSTQWEISTPQLISGLQFRLPEDQGLGKFGPLATALMTFGIIGVGAAELLAYPYWCLEKGYARFTGPAQPTQAWADRASGWLQVLRLDAWLSMLVYTFSTIVFYLLGAAVLHSLGLVPANSQMISALSVMFEPTMGPWGKVIFLSGSVAVLYSTFLVATASHSKTAADAFRVSGFVTGHRSSLDRTYVGLCVLLTTIAIGLVYTEIDPKTIILVGGFFQALMLPVLATTALYFRYFTSAETGTPFQDPRSKSNRLWDLALWCSSAGMFACAAILLWLELAKLF